MPNPDRFKALAVVAPLLVGIAVAWQTHTFGFVHDDFGLIVQNRDLAEPGGTGRLLTGSLERWMGRGYPFYRPLTMLTYASDRTLSGPGPGGGHVTNALLHGCCSLLVGIWALSLGQRRRVALATGLLFALHPAHAEAICWISARADLLSTALALGTWILALGALTRGSSYLAASVLAFAGALLSKESVIVLPVVVLAHGWLAGWRAPGGASPARSPDPAPRRWLVVFAALSACALAWLAIRTVVVGSVPTGLAHQLMSSPGAQVVRCAWALGTQTAAHLVGCGTSRLDYSVARLGQGPPPPAHEIVATLILLGLVIVEWAGRRERGERWVWSVCLLLLLAPLTLNLTRPGTNLIQERYLYLPSAAACLGIARFLVPRTGRPSRASPVVLVGLLLMYGALLVVNLPPWRDARSLWSHQVRVNDRWPVAQGNLAQVLLAQGEPGEACSRFELALALAREQRYTPPEFLLGLGRARLLLGHLDAAEPALLEARRIRADLPRLAANLAFLYLKRGEPDRATPHLEEAMALDRHDVASGVNLAQIYLRRREVARALGLVDALIRENPEDPRLPVLRRSLVGRPPETVR